MIKPIHFTKALVTMTCSLLLVACGGGDDGDGSNSSPTASAAPAPSAVPLPTSTRLSVTDLNIAPENNLESVYTVDIPVDISAVSTSRAFISVCDNSIAQGDLTKLDFENCLLKGSLSQGIGNFDLRIPNHCKELIAIIWIMEKNRTPLTYTLSHDNQKETYWMIN